MKLLIIITIIIFASKPVLAWDGYEMETANQIEILPGNSVKEGLVIEYYDHTANKGYVANVIELDYGYSQGTRLILENLDDEGQRIFIMD